LIKDYRHPNIIEFLGYDTELTVETIYLGFRNGRNLYDFKENHSIWSISISEAFVWSVTTQLDSALAFLHEGYGTPRYQNGWVQIIHGDFKPENVVCHKIPGSYFPNIKLIDFGLSVAIYDPEVSDYRTKKGTAEWQSPERPYARASGDICANGELIHYLCLKETPCDVRMEDKDAAIFNNEEWHDTLERRVIPINILPEERRAQWFHGEATAEWGYRYSDCLNYWLYRKLEIDHNRRITAVQAVKSMGKFLRDCTHDQLTADSFANLIDGMTVEQILVVIGRP
jgi:serine/threonine protein kinase